MNIHNQTALRSTDFTIGGVRYKIFEDGTVYGVKGKLKHHPSADGYATVTLGAKATRKRTYVHRLVAKYFVPKPESNETLEIDHLDGNRMNPAAWNLEWVTHQENIRRAHEKGHYAGRAVGEKNPKARLTEAMVISLRKAYRHGDTITKLAKQYGLPWNTVGNAVKGYTWSHLP